jgi:glycosyltransferase involved in cell wall biosynthesis
VLTLELAEKEQTAADWIDMANGQWQTIKVCFVSPLGYGLYRPQSGLPFGGAEVQTFLMARELSADQAFRVSVLTTVDGEPGVEELERLTLFKRRGLDRLSHWPGWFAGLSSYWSAFRDMREQFRAIDADVYVHAGAGVEVGAYALICRWMRRRFVWVVASMADVNTLFGKVDGPLAWLYPLGVRLADEVICRTCDQQEALGARYQRAGVLIRTGYSVRPGATREPSTILWVGRVHPLKQPLMFLDLAERLPAERCVMVGMRDRTHDELWRRVRERAARLPNVSWHEDVPLRDVDRHFAGAKLFINTSEYEGFPNTFVQAAAHGVPIVSWKVDPDQVLTEHRIGVCAGGSFESLMVSTLMLCKDDERRREFGERAETYAREHHDLVKSVSELKLLLRRLVGQRAAEN